MDFPLDRSYIYTDKNKPKILCLIQELCKLDDSPIFTVRDEKEGFVSLQKLFIDLTVDDPTESVFAESIFGDVHYWLTVRENGRLKPFLDDWRQVANVKRKQLAYEAILSEIKTRGKSAFSAAKFIIDEPHKDKRNPSTKKAVEESKAKAKASAVYSEDYQNIKELLDEQKGHIN